VSIWSLALVIVVTLSSAGIVAAQMNTALGVGALANLTTGHDNTAVGANALVISTGSDNTAVGSEALGNNYRR
jgi:hypothetical protein